MLLSDVSFETIKFAEDDVTKMIVVDFFKFKELAIVDSRFEKSSRFSYVK